VRRPQPVEIGRVVDVVEHDQPALQGGTQAATQGRGGVSRVGGIGAQKVGGGLSVGGQERGPVVGVDPQQEVDLAVVTSASLGSSRSSQTPSTPT
jgi:hypothetical protein